MSTLKFFRETMADASALGIEGCQIIERGRHVLLSGRLSRSPSDGRVRANVRAHRRRRVREIANQDTA